MSGPRRGAVHHEEAGYAGPVRGDVVRGLVAGAAGTTALNAVAYLDMTLRGRPASSTPEETIRAIEDMTDLSLSASGPDSEAARNRRSGLAALLGIATGLAMGAGYGALRPHLGKDVPWPVLAAAAGLGAMVGTNVPMAALGVSDPRTWSASSWLADLVPHLAYGAVTASVFEALTPTPRRRWLRIVRRSR